jgi:hypothetical protein
VGCKLVQLLLESLWKYLKTVLRCMKVEGTPCEKKEVTTRGERVTREGKGGVNIIKVYYIHM